MQVNFWSFTRIAKSLMRGMIRARAGRIVAIGSVAALQGNPGNAAYAASKGALISYCRTLAVETAKRGVTVNVIAPGFIDTDMMAPYAAYRDNKEAWTADSEPVKKIIDVVGGNAADVPGVLALYNFPTMEEQASCAWLGCGTDGGAVKALIYTSEFLKKEKKIPAVLADYTPFVTAQYVEAAMALK